MLRCAILAYSQPDSVDTEKQWGLLKRCAYGTSVGDWKGLAR